jgi:2-phosphoglycerate kinase
MSTFYFIGGAPRSGKSTVLQKLLEQRPMLGASTDAIRAVAKGLLTPEQNPKLFKTARGSFDSSENVNSMRENPHETLVHELGESEETWKSVLDFLSYYTKDGRNAAIEGVAVLPHLLSQSGLNQKAVFIVNLDDQTDIILDHAAHNQSDWLHKYDEQTIRAFCSFNRILNQYYADEAQKYGYPVVQMSGSGFDENISRAVSLLLDDSDSG